MTLRRVEVGEGKKKKKSCSITPHHVVLSWSRFHLCGAIGIFAVVFGFETVTPHHPFLSLSPFHLWVVMLSHAHFTFHSTLFFFPHPELSVDQILHSYRWDSCLFPTSRGHHRFSLQHTQLFQILVSILMLNYSCLLDNRQDLAGCLLRLSGYLPWPGALSLK